MQFLIGGWWLRWHRHWSSDRRSRQFAGTEVDNLFALFRCGRRNNQSQVGDEVGGGRVLGKDRADGIGRGATGEATTCWVFELFPHRPAALLPMLTLIHLGGPSTPG